MEPKRATVTHVRHHPPISDSVGSLSSVLSSRQGRIEAPLSGRDPVTRHQVRCPIDRSRQSATSPCHRDSAPSSGWRSGRAETGSDPVRRCRHRNVDLGAVDLVFRSVECHGCGPSRRARVPAPTLTCRRLSSSGNLSARDSLRSAQLLVHLQDVQRRQVLEERPLAVRPGKRWPDGGS